MVKNLPVNAGDLGLTPGLRRFPGEGNGNPLQYSCLENSMDRGSGWAPVHGVTKSQTPLSMHAQVFRGRDRSEWRRLEMNSSWVGQPVASAMLGLIPWGVNWLMGFCHILFSPPLPGLGVFHPLGLCFGLRRRLWVCGSLGHSSMALGCYSHWASNQTVHGIFHSWLHCFLAVCL